MLAQSLSIKTEPCLGMEGKTFGIPNEIVTILVIDAVIIAAYGLGVQAQKKHLVGAKVLGTSALVVAALAA